MKIRNQRTPSYLAPALGAAAVLLILTAGFRVVHAVWVRFCDGFFYPYAKLTTPSSGIIDRQLLAMDKSRLAAKVTELEERNRRLTLENAAAARLLDENRTMRRMLSLKSPSSWHTLTAEVLYRDPLRAAAGFTIDAGSRSGIVPGAAVAAFSQDLSNDDNDNSLLLVGVVTEVTARTAKVSTIFNPEIHISARIQLGRNSAVGFLNTGTARTERKQLRFGMLPQQADYTGVNGTAAVTTGMERGIPEGLKVGVARTPERYDQSLQNGVADVSLLVEPENDFSILRFVAVFVPAAAK